MHGSFRVGQSQSHFQSQVLAVDEKCHIVPQGPHGLQSLQIPAHVFRAGPVYHVPVLRSDDGHLHEAKILIHLIPGRRSSRSSG